MDIRHNVIDAIGNTPLIQLRKASELTGCNILGKAEFMNPGQSVKDRAALFIIKDAIKRGELKPGGTIVEGTAGRASPRRVAVHTIGTQSRVVNAGATDAVEKQGFHSPSFGAPYVGGADLLFESQ